MAPNTRTAIRALALILLVLTLINLTMIILALSSGPSLDPDPTPASPVPAPQAPNRTALGRPRPPPRQLRLWSLSSGQASATCALLNAVNFPSPLTLATADALLHHAGISTVFALTDRSDVLADELLSQRGQHKDVDLGQGLQLGGCERVVYMQSGFRVSEQAALGVADVLNQGGVRYSARVRLAGAEEQLPRLDELDLASLQYQDFSKYMLVFPTKYLKLLGPLNFAYYARFTLDQIIAIPVLALAQKAKQLEPFHSILHQLDRPVIQFKQFALSPLKQDVNSPCFVSYPSDPQLQSQQQITRYVHSLTNLELTGHNASVVIFLPYSYTQTHGINQSYLLTLFDSLTATKKFISIKLILKHSKTVSSLAAYQSAYSYCPARAIMITSRHNVEFLPRLPEVLVQSLTEQRHYYYLPFSIGSGQPVHLQQQQLKWNASYQFRQGSQLYPSHFQHVQAFKADLLKTNYFWLLKKAELDFYQTEASFVVPMLETVRLRVGVVAEPALVVHPREKSQTELNEELNIKKYVEWSPLEGNKLAPYAYNCLMNEAFRRNAPEKIPRKIHQVWMGGAMSQFQAKLHETLKTANPHYEMKLWRAEDITLQNFPLGYSLITRSLEYQKTSRRSYFAPIASLIRYQALYHYGGIYFDFKTEGVRPMDPFLKYEIFFTDGPVGKLRFGQPQTVGNGIMGAVKHSYYLKYVLTELITQSTVDYNVVNFPKIVGAYILRRSLNEEEFFTGIGLGFHLLSPRPETDDVSECGTQTSFSFDQQVFDVPDQTKGKIYKIAIPCRQYPEAYALMYKPLGRTWIGDKKH